jgi:Tfp pilus assembly protein PilO
MTTKATWGLALLVGAVVLLAGLAALPFALHASELDGLAEKRLELRFMEARLKAAQGDPKNRLTEADEIGPLFVKGTTAGLAIAEMQDFASQLAQSSGLQVLRLQPLQADRDGDLSALRIEADVTGSLDGLSQFLLKVEAGQPFIFVNRMKIVAPENASATGALPSDQLTATLQLESFGWWKDAAP